MANEWGGQVAGSTKCPFLHLKAAAFLIQWLIILGECRLEFRLLCYWLAMCPIAEIQSFWVLSFFASKMRGWNNVGRYLKENKYSNNIC